MVPMWRTLAIWGWAIILLAAIAYFYSALDTSGCSYVAAGLECIGP
ncbi:hypothetical protein LCGC14_0445150 [marine sediment metagenome]|uniref:Uncharacterized protein n=1 Tax=marine sediment metagenome TaxID=412755 RepID=A0A0F9VTF9_9ZZZZ